MERDVKVSRKSEFAVGDVVQLKSGGAAMTVTIEPCREQKERLGLSLDRQWTGGAWLISMRDDGRLAWSYLPTETLKLVDA